MCSNTAKRENFSICIFHTKSAIVYLENMKKPIDLILFSILLAVIGQVLLKNGMNDIGRIGSGGLSHYASALLKGLFNIKVIFGFILYFGSALSWMIVLSRTELSFAFPFLAISYVLIMLISWIFFKEPVNIYRWTGTFFTVIGIVFISRT